jgi:hypothetical protein
MKTSTANGFLSPKEGLALTLIFETLGESRFNRTQNALAAKYKYIRVALRAPKLASLHAYVNQRLKKMAAAGEAPFEICTFKPEDKYHRYDKFPKSLSVETVRKAWTKSGMREVQIYYRRLKAKYDITH